MTYKEIDAATQDAFQRGSKALEEAQARPCALCGNEPRLRGDHYGKLCRSRVNETRRLAGIDIEKEVER